MDDSQLDLGAQEDFDPSLEGGFKIQFDREIHVETRVQDANTGPQEIGTLELVRVKILVQGEQQTFENLKIELTSETDLFFNYITMYWMKEISLCYFQNLYIRKHDYINNLLIRLHMIRINITLGSIYQNLLIITKLALALLNIQKQFQSIQLRFQHILKIEGFLN